MKWLTLQQIKMQLRIEEDNRLEDALLTTYGEAAEETILDLIRMDFPTLAETYDGVPARLQQASMMLVDLSYQERSPASVQSLSVIPYSFDILVKPFMRLSGD